LLLPYPDELLSAWPISRRVNSPKSNDEQLIEPVELA
jgi:putative SOS response-associated peptidase YedK